MSDTDFLAFEEWVRRLPGNWKYRVSASESARRLGGMIIWSTAFEGSWAVADWVIVAGAIHGVTFCNEGGEAECVICNVHFSLRNSRERRAQYAQLRSELPRAKWILLGGDHNRSDTEGDRLFLQTDAAGEVTTRWTVSEAPERQAWQHTAEDLGIGEVWYEGTSFQHRGGDVLGRNDRWFTSWTPVDSYLWQTHSRVLSTTRRV